MRRLPLIVDIKRHSLEDGPGIRSVVFFKGCPLRCVFCQNPEAQDPRTEIAFCGSKCIYCGMCAVTCPRGAIDPEGPERIYREQCDRCGLCTDACGGGALRRIGSYYPVETLTEILLRDLAFYRHSGGGVTLSGGECTLFPGYLELLLGHLKARDVHVAIETSGYFDYRVFRDKILPFVDLVYYDVKIANPNAHRRQLGKSNRRILNNLRRLLQEERVEVLPRVPIVPEITATWENLRAIVDALSEAGAKRVSLLSYNPLGLEMAERLGRPRPPLQAAFMKPEEETEISAMLTTLIENKGKLELFAHA